MRRGRAANLERRRITERDTASEGRTRGDGSLALFVPQAAGDLGESVARCLGGPIAQHEKRDFEDGEHKMRPLESVRGRDVFVLQSLFSEPDRSVNDKLCRLSSSWDAFAMPPSAESR